MILSGFKTAKEVLDRGALKALAECDDNNARHSLLERFRDYVLPNYDDPQSVYPEIKDQLVAAVKTARTTPRRPIETPFGDLPGVPGHPIVYAVSNTLTNYRHFTAPTT